MVERLDFGLKVVGSNPTLFLLFLQNNKKAGLDMNNLLRASEAFVKKNASTILTCVGGAGVIGTTIMAVKATPKALERIETAEEIKGEKLTKMEVVQVAGPVYIPTEITGAATIAFIFGANILNQKKQAALMSAYALLDSSYKEYRNKVTELYGEDADSKVKNEVAKDHMKDVKKSDDPETRLFYDEYSERYFESTTERVLTAEYALNRMLSIDYGVYLNEFYEFLGIDTVDYGDYMGWSTYELVEYQWNSWVEFEHSKVILDDGLECTIIRLLTEPSFDFENY